ncbi:MAG TPA: TetR/AcrR family transcriptional regulator [Anaerolineales bacterium]|nr:TetR/AcrR family transcriptional regulator [Anaerolineales bacterium]
MVRVIKEEVHSAKRNEILDAALTLVYAKGYSRMTVQDILDQLQISKGAFYHYFDSKADVLEALVERMVVEQMEPLLLATIRDPNLTALEKLQCYFDTAVRWKSAKKNLVMELTRVWYSDENALARQKMYALMVAHVTPLFNEIIDQGAREGTFTTPYPEQASLMNIGLIQSLGDTFAQMLLVEELGGDDRLERAKRLVAAYNDAIERVLGAPHGSIRLMDDEALKEWFPASDGIPARGA